MKKTKDHNHTSITINEYLDYLKHLKYSPKSIKSYKHALNRFHSFLTAGLIIRVQDVTLKDIKTYRLELVDQEYSDQSISLYLRAVRKLFKYLEETRQIFINPAANLIIPAPVKKLMPIPDESEMSILLTQPDLSNPTGLRDRAIMETFYSTGIRLEELLAMKVFDAERENGTVKVIGKGNRQRVVPLGREAGKWIKRYITEARPVLLKNKPDQKALWLGAKGKQIHPLIVERTVRGYGITAGIRCNITPHGLRRACATHMLRNGAHPVQIQMLLGHSTLSALSHYLKITITDMKAMHEKGNPGK